jgi:tripartite-type tricarboxylate transporter receptor subunit TctC
MKRSRLFFASAAIAAGLSVCIAAGPASADAVADFYKGRTVTVVVPSGEGGMTALYARTVGDRLVGHIPGRPRVIYQYMPGGGGLKGANYCYNLAARDGTVICEPVNAFVLLQVLLPKGIKYDAGKFGYVGSAADSNGSFVVWHTVKAKTLLDVRNEEIPLAGTGKGSESYYDPALVNALFGTRFKMVMGYKGGGALDLSMERQETLGRAGPLLSWPVRKQRWIDEGKIRFLAQVGLRKAAGFEKVPLLEEFARSDEERRMIRFISSRSAMGRPFVVPPGVPSDRLAALRTAFVATMTDAAFQSDIRKRRLTSDWRSGKEVEKIVGEMLAAPVPLVKKIRATLGWDRK